MSLISNFCERCGLPQSDTSAWHYCLPTEQTAGEQAAPLVAITDKQINNIWLRNSHYGLMDWGMFVVAVRAILATTEAPREPETALVNPGVDDLMELARQYAHAYFNHYTGSEDGMLVKTESALRAALDHPAAPGSSDASRAPLSEPCALDQGARPVRLLTDAQREQGEGLGFRRWLRRERMTVERGYAHDVCLAAYRAGRADEREAGIAPPVAQPGSTK